MRANSAVAIALQLPLFAAAATHGHGHNHAEAHRRALTTEVHFVTRIVYETVTVEPSSAASTTSSSASPSSAIKLPDKAPVVYPSATAPSTDDKPFNTLVAVPESAIIVNSCDYHVYVSSVGHKSCSSGANCKLLPANGTYSEPIRACDTGGISLKVTKADDGINPMQFEYTLWDNKKTVSYDISYLDCMKNANGEQDLSACAGHDGGIQAAGGADGCEPFQCVANEWCSQKAYVVAEFGYQPGAPVGGCNIEAGIAFELCAQNRA